MTVSGHSQNIKNPPGPLSPFWGIFLYDFEKKEPIGEGVCTENRFFGTNRLPAQRGIRRPNQRR